MAASPDHLSDLPDELLRRILSFAPAREAASTAVLSRRWRGVWPTTPSPAVVLDTRLYDRACRGGGGGRSYFHDRWYIDRDAFFNDAEAALAAHRTSGGGIRYLSVHIEADGPESVQSFMSQYQRHNWHARYVAGDVLGHPACAAVEVLTVSGVPSYLSRAATARRRATLRKHEQSAVADKHAGYYKLSLGSLPSAALRVLNISGCKNLTPPPPPATAAFPCLEAIRLHRCAVALCTLQDMIAASPRLAALHLESVYIRSKACRPTPDDDENYYYGGGGGGGYGYGRNNDDCFKNNDDDDDRGRNPVEQLCCPGVTSLVLASCSCKDSLRIEVDAPRVRSFMYRGHVDRFVLKSPMPDLQRADLHFLDGNKTETCECFWLFVRSLCSTGSLKLKLNFPMGDIAVVDGKKRLQEELLGDTLFVNLDRLVVDGQYEPGSEGVAVAIGNLLQCCPMLRDLKLKLNTVDRKFGRRGYTSEWSDRLYKSTFLDRKSKMDTCKSAEHFARRRNLEFSVGDDDFQVSDLPGLSDKWFDFNCLRGSLRRVSLQFRMDKQSTSFGMQLVKFFFERAMVLEEMYIDDGNRKMCEHINRKVVVGGCTANASHPCSEYQVSAAISQLFGGNQLNSKMEERRRNRWSTSFKILPLES
ncbi:unnamed protein product [Urochloa decumbens]|uniref:F-box domain-containing protein n=1 Tax=Urochloa decumbens TaxID=240449 RepID=A0ABC9AIA3_9POAL